jgi:putative ABC transport system permease protein
VTFLHRFASIVRWVARRKRAEQDLDDELRSFVEMAAADQIRDGATPREARRQAVLGLGGVQQVKERVRTGRYGAWLDEIARDVRYALRMCGRNPGFSAVVVVTLALGIGANGAMFALADAALLRPLPFPDSHRLVVVEERDALRSGSLRSWIAPFNFRDWTEQNETFETMAAVYVPPGGGGPAMMGADGTPEIVQNQNVTARFFDVFGVTPVLGRTFVPADETSGEAMAVLGEAFWRTSLGADPSVVGRPLLFDGQPRTIVGIVPSEFQFFRPNSVWLLLQTPRDEVDGRRLSALRVVGRMKPGVALDAARADLNRIADVLALEFGDTREGRRVTVEPFRNELVGDELRLTAFLFLGVVGFVLLICSANIASLLLARDTARARELATRSALGAGRGRIIRQLVTEGLVLAALGGIAGAVVGSFILMAAPAVLPPGLIPGGITLAFDGRVAAFCAVASLAVGAAFGLVPALNLAAPSLAPAIAGDGRTVTARGGPVRSLLVATQTAVAVVLLCGAGLLLRTLVILDSFDPGYRAPADSLLTMDVTVYRSAAEGGSRFRTGDEWLSFYDAVEREMAAVPGVRGAAWATTLPMGDSQTGNMSFQIVGDAPVAESNRPQADYQIVSPSYFATVDIPIVAGRAFTVEDRGKGRQVSVVNEAFARRYLNGRNPIGQRIKIRRHSDVRQLDEIVEVEREIVGIARQVKGRADETADLAQIYVPNTQDPWAESYLLVRTAGPADALTPSIRAAIARVDKGLPVRSVKTLEQIGEEGTARYRFRAGLLTTFAGLALLLAMAGIFGVQAYSVQQRWREFGVRIALGATRRNILALVVSGASRVVGAGIFAGLAAAMATSRTISAFLFGVQPMDVATFGVVIGVMALAAATAAVVPAMRATRVDPAVALREE